MSIKRVFFVTLILIAFLPMFGQDIKILEKQAKSGDVESMIDLGLYYYKKDKTKDALKWLDKAVQAGNVKAMYYSGEIYLEQDPDSKLGRQYILAAAEGNVPQAQYRMYELYAQQGKYDNASDMLYKAANNGSEPAMLKILEFADYELAEQILNILGEEKQAELLELLEYDNSTYSKGTKDALYKIMASEGQIQYARRYLDEIKDLRNTIYTYDGYNEGFKAGDVRGNYDNLSLAIDMLKLANYSKSELKRLFRANLNICYMLLILGGEENEKTAFEILSEWDGSHTTNSQRNWLLAKCYLEGIGTEVNMEKGLEICTNPYTKDQALKRLTALYGGETDFHHSDYAVRYENGQKGAFSNLTNTYVIPLGKYVDIKTDFASSGIYEVVDDKGNHGLINYLGKEVAPVKYEAFYDSNGPYIEAYMPNGKMDVYTRKNKGQLFVPHGRYDRIGKVNGGNLVVYRNNKMGLVDGNTGNELVAPEYDMYAAFLATTAICFF